MIQTVDVASDGDLDKLDRGERAAIMLVAIGADLIVIDDLLGRQMASSLHLITGLLGVLDEAARRKLVDFLGVIARLQQTTFRASSKLIQLLLQRRRAEDKL